LQEKVEIVKYGNKIRRKLRDIQKDGPEKYLMVVTGHQGEPKSTLSKIAKDIFKFQFKPEDHVIFSCTIIPTDINRTNRENLENLLTQKKLRIFRDIHVSGHAAKEDLRDLLTMLKPKHLIPAHGNTDMKNALSKLAEEKGYSKHNIHILSNGYSVVLKQ